MKKGQVAEGIVERVDFPNKGIVSCDDGICVVKNVLPGQKISCRINKVRKGKGCWKCWSRLRRKSEAHARISASAGAVSVFRCLMRSSSI